MEFRRLLICVMDSFSSCNCTWSWWPAPVCFDKAVRKSESSSVLNRGFTVTKCLFSSQLSTNIRNSLCLFNLNFILPLFNVFFNFWSFFNSNLFLFLLPPFHTSVWQIFFLLNNFLSISQCLFTLSQLSLQFHELFSNQHLRAKFYLCFHS